MSLYLRDRLRNEMMLVLSLWLLECGVEKLMVQERHNTWMGRGWHL
jgi:hypothetical protein